jgi:hypothetical protein
MEADARTSKRRPSRSSKPVKEVSDDRDSIDRRRARPWSRYALLALMVLPGIWLALLVYMYGVNVPYWDEWDNSVQLHMKYLDGTLTLGDFFEYTNEHRPALPRAIDLAIEIATHGNRRVEMFAQILCAGFAVFCIFRLAKKTLPDHALPLTAVASWFVFSTVHYENWLWGEQLILVLPITLLWFGLWVIYSDRSYWFKVIVGTATGIAAVCCFAAGFVIFALLGAVQLIRAREKRLNMLMGVFVWVTAFSTCSRLFVMSPPKSDHGPMIQLLWLAPGISALYIDVFFGAPFGSHQPPIVLVLSAGAVLILVALVGLARIRHAFDRTLPWLAVLAFSGTMAVLTLAGRLQFGIQQAMTSRYAYFAVLLPIATLFIWGITFPLWSKGVRRTIITVGVLLFAAHLYASAISIPDMRNTYINRTAGLEELPYINIHDDEVSNVILHEIYPERERLKAIANDYAAHGFLPPMVKP